MGMLARVVLARSYARGTRWAKLDTQAVRGLLGVLLADGCLTRRKAPTRSYVIAAMHGSPKEQDFLDEKAAEVRLFVPTLAQVTPYRTRRRDSGNRTTVLRFRFTSGALLPIYNLLYPHGEREITRATLEILGGRAAAWLWAEGARLLDDGSVLLRRVGRWNDEARLISGWLELLTGAPSSIVYPAANSSRNGMPRLFFEAGAVRRLQRKLVSYAPQSRRSLFAIPEE